MKYRWDSEKQELVELTASRPRERQHIITDTMDQTFSHADGKFYDSKSRMRKNASAAGFEHIGDDSTDWIKGNKKDPHADLKQDIINSVRQLTN